MATARPGSTIAGGIDAFKRLAPLNLYGWSKHAFDLWALRAAAAGQAPPFWFGLKFFNVFGPNEHHKGDMTSLVVKNYPRILAGETIGLFKSHRPDYADGEQLRDFVYVKDCVAAMLWLWRHGSPAEISGIYNLGTGEARSFLDLIGALGAACGVRRRSSLSTCPTDPAELPVLHPGLHEPASRQPATTRLHPARRRRPRLRAAPPREPDPYL